jgi:hypothetical protein
MREYDAAQGRCRGDICRECGCQGFNISIITCCVRLHNSHSPGTHAQLALQVCISQLRLDQLPGYWRTGNTGWGSGSGTVTINICAIHLRSRISARLRADVCALAWRRTCASTSCWHTSALPCLPTLHCSQGGLQSGQCATTCFCCVPCLCQVSGKLGCLQGFSKQTGSSSMFMARG